MILPPSETKAAPLDDGPPVALGELSFPELTETRQHMLEALMETSARLDAFRLLHTRPSQAPDVARNTHLLDVPTRPVLEIYTGPLYQGLDAARLSGAAMKRADDHLVVVSPLWGLLRPCDRIPRYRLHLYAQLVGIDGLEDTWRAVLPDVLADAAGRSGVVVDFRSPSYQAMGVPTELGDRTVTIRVDQGPPGYRVAEVIAKRVRGRAARHLLEQDAEPRDPDALAEVLADRWPVRLEAPKRPGRPWTMTLWVDP